MQLNQGSKGHLILSRDNGYKDVEVKTNTIQMLKQSGIYDVRSL